MALQFCSELHYTSIYTQYSEIILYHIFFIDLSQIESQIPPIINYVSVSSSAVALRLTVVVGNAMNYPKQFSAHNGGILFLRLLGVYNFHLGSKM